MVSRMLNTKTVAIVLFVVVLVYAYGGLASFGSNVTPAVLVTSDILAFDLSASDKCVWLTDPYYSVSFYPNVAVADVSSGFNFVPNSALPLYYEGNLNGFDCRSPTYPTPPDTCSIGIYTMFELYPKSDSESYSICSYSDPTTGQSVEYARVVPAGPDQHSCPKPSSFPSGAVCTVTTHYVGRPAGYVPIAENSGVVSGGEVAQTFDPVQVLNAPQIEAVNSGNTQAVSDVFQTVLVDTSSYETAKASFEQNVPSEGQVVVSNGFWDWLLSIWNAILRFLGV